MPKFSDDIAALEATLALCPKKGCGYDSIEVTSNGVKVTLTAETRKKIEALLRELKRR